MSAECRVEPQSFELGYAEQKRAQSCFRYIELAIREYAVVLLDLYLGAMSGFDVLDFMRDANIRIAVIVISGAEEQALVAARQSPLVKLVMPKPLDSKKLIGTLKKLLAVDG